MALCPCGCAVGRQLRRYASAVGRVAPFVRSADNDRVWRESPAAGAAKLEAVSLLHGVRPPRGNRLGEEGEAKTGIPLLDRRFATPCTGRPNRRAASASDTVPRIASSPSFQGRFRYGADGTPRERRCPVTEPFVRPVRRATSWSSSRPKRASSSGRQRRIGRMGAARPSRSRRKRTPERLRPSCLATASSRMVPSKASSSRVQNLELRSFRRLRR